MDKRKRVYTQRYQARQWGIHRSMDVDKKGSYPVIQINLGRVGITVKR